MNNYSDENYSEDNENYVNYTENPSPYRNDDHFKMPSIPQVSQYSCNKEYIVITFDTHQIFRGIFDDWDTISDIDEENYTTYSHMPNRVGSSFVNYYFTCNNKKYMFSSNDYYYEVEIFICQIKHNAENARKQMEQRSLDMILKRLVNEEFDWSLIV